MPQDLHKLPLFPCCVCAHLPADHGRPASMSLGCQTMRTECQTGITTCVVLQARSPELQMWGHPAERAAQPRLLWECGSLGHTASASHLAPQMTFHMGSQARRTPPQQQICSACRLGAHKEGAARKPRASCLNLRGLVGYQGPAVSSRARISLAASRMTMIGVVLLAEPCFRATIWLVCQTLRGKTNVTTQTEDTLISTPSRPRHTFSS